MTTEIIEGEAVEVPSESAVVRYEQPSSVTVASPLYDIGELSNEEFERRKDQLTAGVRRIEDLQRSLLVEDKEGKGRSGDWGTLPGVNRPIIYKSGAEKLANFYRLVPEFIVSREEVKATDLGFAAADRPNRITYTVHTLLHAGTQDGPVVGAGEGVASSWEKKYLFRAGNKVCPTCGKPTLRMGTKRDSNVKEWYCWKKPPQSDGCGDRFELNDPRIASGADTMNTEPWDLENTLVKIAKKRSHVDAVLATLGASALFTQDVEEEGASHQPEDTRDEGQRRASGAGQAAERAGDGPDSAAPWFEGTVIKPVPDRVREKERPTTLKADEYDPWSELGVESVAQLELKFKASGKNHTAIVLGDAAYMVRAAELAEGDTVRVDGDLHMVEWDSSKPKMRQIWHVKSVWVKRGEEWFPLSGEEVAPTLPLERPEEAPDEARQGGVQPPDWNALPRVVGEEHAVFDGELYFISGRRAKSTSGVPFAELRLHDQQRLYVVLMSEEDADASKVDDLTAGEKVHVVGGWDELPQGWAIIAAQATSA